MKLTYEILGWKYPFGGGGGLVFRIKWALIPNLLQLPQPKSYKIVDGETDVNRTFLLYFIKKANKRGNAHINAILRRVRITIAVVGKH